MNRNQTSSNKQNISKLKHQVQKYDSLQTGSSFLGYSKKQHKFIIRERRKL